MVILKFFVDYSSQFSKSLLNWGITASAVLITVPAMGQDSTKVSYGFELYIEPYYLLDRNKPADQTRADFIYSYNRSNQLNANLILGRGFIEYGRTRANFGLMTGTYVEANLATEPVPARYVFEANLGIRIGRKQLWLDAGVMPSHIGFESAIGIDCWTLTRSLLADNSPYYETGIKMSYTTANNKWFFAALALNGWQRIVRPTGMRGIPIGTQITYNPNSKVSFNSSTFIGNDIPSSTRTRYFHNFYCIIDVSKALSFTGGLDIGWQQTHERKRTHRWVAPIVLMRIRMNERWASTLRGELYQDPDGAIVRPGDEAGLKSSGVSLNLDYRISPNVVLRGEARHLSAASEVFPAGAGEARSHTFFAAALCIRVGRQKETIVHPSKDTSR